MARGGAGGHQRDQSTRLEAPRTVQLAGARSRKRTPKVIDLLSEEEEDGDIVMDEHGAMTFVPRAHA